MALVRYRGAPRFWPTCHQSCRLCWWRGLFLGQPIFSQYICLNTHDHQAPTVVDWFNCGPGADRMSSIPDFAEFVQTFCSNKCLNTSSPVTAGSGVPHQQGTPISNESRVTCVRPDANDTDGAKKDWAYQGSGDQRKMRELETPSKFTRSFWQIPTIIHTLRTTTTSWASIGEAEHT